MTQDERYEAWREEQLLKLKAENIRLKVELAAMSRVLPAPKDEPWHGMPYPRARARRRA